MIFEDRRDAARRLLEALREVDLREPLVLGIPRGGVALAHEVARGLGADLDVVLARKLRAPTQPELAIGAVGEDGSVYLDPNARMVPGATEERIEEERRREMGEIRERRERFRGGRAMAPVAGRSVVVVDDGIATGSTMIAALAALRGQGAREVIAAVPVGPPDRVREIGRRCDRVVCLHSPEGFGAVGQFYRTFDQVDDETVASLLGRGAAERSESGDER